jgi:recombination protein RecR
VDNTLLRLVDALRCLPGVGPKSAQRMAYYLLHNQRDKGLHLASCLHQAMESMRHCNRCNNLTTQNVCHLCSNENRDSGTICIVESPADVHAIEQSQSFNGCYFILMGKISPIDGVGPDDIGLHKLQQLVKNEPVNEVILALSPTVEGRATGHFIHELLQGSSIRISQLAHGIPSGGELEFLDSYTIRSALQNRLVY